MSRMALLALLLLLTTPFLRGTTRLVPQEYATIQAAINAAHPADTVLVSEGHYLENIRFQGKSIVVTSRFFITRDWQTVFHTVIDGRSSTNKDTASTVQFLYGEDSLAVLQGFTITGGTGTKVLGGTTVQEGAGIYLRNSTAQIIGNYIAHNVMTPAPGVNNGGGGGISSYYGNPTIRNNIIFSNSSGYAGGIVLNWSRGKIRNNLVYHNAAIQQWGAGGIMVWQAPNNGGIVENNTIVGNTSAAVAGGLSISVTDAGTIPVVRNNIVWGNRQATGGQITSPQYVTYNCVEDVASGSNVSVPPQFQDSSFSLSPGSPCIDAGDPAPGCQDAADPLAPGFPLAPSRGGLRNDLGASGGPWAAPFPALRYCHLHVIAPPTLQSPVGKPLTVGIEVLNLGTEKVVLDSITHTNTTAFAFGGGTSIRSLELLRSDSVALAFQSPFRGRFADTLRIYHRLADTANPIVVSIAALANSAPFLHKALPPQNPRAGQIFTLQIPDTMFLDIDQGDSLSFQVTGLPGWLSFNPQTRTFSGTPPAVDGIPWIIGVSVRDLLQAGAASTFHLLVQSASGIEDAEEMPGSFALHQNYPNPFNPTTHIQFTLVNRQLTIVKLYDVLGKEVTTLVNELKDPGTYTVRFDGADLASGVYVCRMTAGEYSASRKMVLLK